MSIKIVSDKVKKALASVAALGNKRVLIGIPESKGARQGGDISNAQLGYIHEYGSTANNIPPRPFLNPAVALISGKASEILKGSAIKAIEGDESSLEKGLHTVGILGQLSVKKYIKVGSGFAPLAPVTLYARKRAGAQGTKPLIRTGQLLNSINYEIREK